MTPEEYATLHKKAFRCAFDFLNEHFPPSDDSEWWLKTAKDCSAASYAFGEEPVIIWLLDGVMNYLNEEYKRRYQNGKVDD